MADTTAIKGKNWTRKINISKEKYDSVSGAILKVLTSEGVRFSEVEDKVKKELPEFEGSVGWYTISVLRDLEIKEKVSRNKGKIVTYSKKGEK